MTTEANVPEGTGARPSDEGSEDGRVRIAEVHAKFRHSAGRLGTHYLRVIRDEGRLVGWRSGNPPRVQIPPKDTGFPGEWVEVGPGAALQAYAPTDWVARNGQAAAGLALVHIDGADTTTLAQLRPAVSGPESLAPGARLVVRFGQERTGSVTDFWFEPEAGPRDG